MKFCCVEYTTKTGRVWVPSVEHPNYLADPIRVIDPTSFGSYTTALNGEHVPLSGVVLGHLGHGYPFQGLFQRIHRRLTGRWGLYSLSYFKKFDTMLAVYDWRRGREIAEFVRRVREELPHIVVVGVPTQPFGALRESWRVEENLRPLVEFYNNCHAVLSVVRATVPYQQALTKTPVVYIPQPYPVEYAERYWHSEPEKDRILFVAGETTRPDILAGHLAARMIQQRHPELTIHITKTPGSPLNTHILDGTRHGITPFRPWREHLTYLSRVKIALNTDTWWTRGRVQADCAAVGTPSIGGPSDGQQELFPDLLIRDVEDFPLILDLASRLLGDLEFYEKVTMRAKHRLASYNFTAATERFHRLVQCIREDHIEEFPNFIWKNDVLTEVPRTP